MKTIGVVTAARSDYGIYLPVLRELEQDPELCLRLYVTGMHLSPEFGLTVRQIEADNFEIAERVESLVSSDTPQGIAKSIGLGTIGFAQSYARSAPDVLMVLGDRFEMYCAALAALPFRIPVAHIHGGEVTRGAIDDSLRHSITKLSHIHFVATKEYAERVMRMGEEPWRVTVTGAPSLDNVARVRLLSAAELETGFGLHLYERPLLVTFHPTTLEYDQAEWQVGELLAALDTLKRPVVFTMPNADTGGRIIGQLIEHYVRRTPRAQVVTSLGTQGYLSLMALAAAMVGNSSSGIVEAAAFELPVVNIGDRQEGRIRARNVIDVGFERDEVIAAVERAVSPAFRAALTGMENPFGDGNAASRIVRKLREIRLDCRLIIKSFFDDYPQAGR